MYAGVESVETSLGNDQVIVKGVIDPAKLVDYVYKRTKKQASIVKEEVCVNGKRMWFYFVI